MCPTYFGGLIRKENSKLSPFLPYRANSLCSNEPDRNVIIIHSSRFLQPHNSLVVKNYLKSANTNHIHPKQRHLLQIVLH